MTKQKSSMSAEQKVRAAMAHQGLSAMVLATQRNFAWLTGGGSSAVDEQSDRGEATLIVTEDEVYLVANNIEMQRLLDEQVGSLEVEPVVHSWTDNGDEVIDGLLNRLLKKEPTPATVGSDTGRPQTTDTARALAHQRSLLTSGEQDAYRSFGPLTSQCVESVLQRIEPGWTERRIRNEVITELGKEKIKGSIVQVGSDSRLFDYRHVIPTDKPVRDYVLVAVCAEKFGLIANTSRAVHFGPAPEDLMRKHLASAEILSRMIAATSAERPLSELWQVTVDAYRALGHEDEWRHHHQGGPTGYAPREFVVTPTTDGHLHVGQAIAWNPSIAGTKAEDTVLVTENGAEVVTKTESWPTISFDLAGTTMHRAALVERS